MGVFSNMRKGHDNDFDSGEKELEEQYQQLFKKIARDFVLLEDLRKTMHRMNAFISAVRRINPELAEEIEEDMEVGSESAILKAIEYKNNLEQPRNKRRKYRDVTDDR
jgi:hypothetical protein